MVEGLLCEEQARLCQLLLRHARRSRDAEKRNYVRRFTSQRSRLCHYRTDSSKCDLPRPDRTRRSPLPLTYMSQLNKYSAHITQPKSQGASQAMLYATGMTEADLNKPQVGIASVWFEGNPCNMHLLDLAAKVKEGVTAAGLVGMRFNTIGVSDGISMGTDGMSFSLQSRDLIADSIETIMGGQWYDAAITIPGCDKNMPGCVMAMGRLNRPSLMVYGGTIRAGCAKIGGKEEKLDVVSAFQSYGQSLAGTITEEERRT